MKVFKFLVFLCSPKRNRSKLDPRSIKCISLGVKSGFKGHIFYDLQNKIKIFISRDTIFFEIIHPTTLSQPQLPPTPISTTLSILIFHLITFTIPTPLLLPLLPNLP